MLINIDGLNINYETKGEGEVVFLLHGWGGEIDSFKPVFDCLSKKFKVYAIDFPGFGKSQLPSDVWGVEEYADNLYKIFESLNVEKASIIAHSFGGRVSIIFSNKYPDKVNKMILVDSGGLIKKRSLKYYYKVYSFKILKKIYLAFVSKEKHQEVLEKFYKKFGSQDFKNADGNLRKIFTKVVNQNLKEYLKNIKASTLLIWGENDKDTPVSFGKIMEKEIPDAGLIVFKNAGHFSYLDKLNDFCAIATNFLENEK